MLKISIITINFNNLQGLKRTLDSISNQSCKDFEWIVVDGGSTDGSVNLINEYTSHITKWISESDRGIYNAMNKGVSLASGDYCLFINSGDTLFSVDSIKKLNSYSLKADLISCDLMKKGKFYSYGSLPDNISFRFMMGSSLPHPATLIKRDHLVSYPYNENYRIISDWSFFFDELIIRGASYQHCSFPLSVFYLDGISNSNRYLSIEERAIHLSNYFPDKFIKEQFNYSQGDTYIRAAVSFYPFNRYFVDKLCKFIYVFETYCVKYLKGFLYSVLN